MERLAISSHSDWRSVLPKTMTRGSVMSELFYYTSEATGNAFEKVSSLKWGTFQMHHSSNPQILTHISAGWET